VLKSRASKAGIAVSATHAQARRRKGPPGAGRSDVEPCGHDRATQAKDLTKGVMEIKGRGSRL